MVAFHHELNRAGANIKTIQMKPWMTENASAVGTAFFQDTALDSVLFL